MLRFGSVLINHFLPSGHRLSSKMQFRQFLLHFQSRKFLSRHIRRRKFGDYDLVVPKIKKKFPELKPIPDTIETPKYYKNGNPQNGPKLPEIKTPKQIDGMRESCKLARDILDSIHSVIKVGMTTDELDDFVHNLTVSRGAYPSPLNYRGFPKSICTSVNNVVCHGIPDDRPLHDGDIVNVDITVTVDSEDEGIFGSSFVFISGVLNILSQKSTMLILEVYYKGYHGDCSAMFMVGNVDQKGKDLVRVTLESLNAAVKLCGPGKPLNEIGETIERIAEKNRMRVVADYVGHGIGSYFHGPPNVYHYANSEEGHMMPGMTFTIEPILSQGSGRMRILADDWTSVTRDGSRAAQWEHTILITPSGAEVLTGPDYVLPEG